MFNMHFDSTKRDLTDLFSPFGEIEKIDLIFDRQVNTRDGIVDAVLVNAPSRA